MNKAWRIVKRKHAARAFDGEDARHFGGRWNQPGHAVVYTADSLALAALEQLIHLGREGLSISFVYFEITIPETVEVLAWQAEDLPRDWAKKPPPSSTMELGSNWVRYGESAVLRVPSVITPQGNNLVFNPNHPDFAKLKIDEPVPFSIFGQTRPTPRFDRQGLPWSRSARR